MSALLVERPYTEEDCGIIREKWIEGWTDKMIGKLIDRTDKSVQGKRRDLQLTIKFHPERAKLKMPGNGRRSYTEADEKDILSRFNSGEYIKHIAVRYNVTVRAMGNKIDRLLERRPEGELIGRTCLWCRRWFFSRQPKSINRRCMTCESQDEGASFLTVFGAVDANPP